MTKLRDFFAVNAPEVPDWYKTNRLEYPKFTIQEPQHPVHFSTEEMKKIYFDWLSDPCWDLEETELHPISKQWEFFWEQRTIYNEQRKQALLIHRVTNWRYFYADQMIAERSKTIKPKDYCMQVFIGSGLILIAVLIFLYFNIMEKGNAIL